MHIHEATSQIPKGARIPGVEPERNAPRAKVEARTERSVERKPVKAEKPVPAHHYGAGF